MIEKFKEQIKISNADIKKNNLKPLPLNTIEKISGGSGSWIRATWNKAF